MTITPVARARKRYSVLAVDGGGIRGIVPARVLQAIEARMQQPVSALFDLVAGTSTGGLVALGLTKPASDDPAAPAYTAADLVNLYLDHGGEIFHSSLAHRIATAGGVFGVRYPAGPIEAVLADRFGDTMLSQALTEVVVPSYDLSGPAPFFFKRRYGRDDPALDVEMAVAARATSAAPTYFEPAAVAPFPGETRPHALVDGGVFANNPAVSAYAEALDLWRDQVEIQVVSIGTGQPPQEFGRGRIPVPYAKARHWGLAHWARPVLEVVFDGVADASEWQLKRLCRHADGDSPRYHRLQSPLPTANHALDDASKDNLERLLADAETLLDAERATLEGICDALHETAADRLAADTDTHSTLGRIVDG
jgi:predicted acylesterase/phospholipase RssA